MVGVATAGKAWVYFYHGKAAGIEDLDGAELEAKQRLWDESAKQLRELYDQGVPFFTKAVFRNVLDQLEHCRANPRTPGHGPPNPYIISIPTMNGTTVELELETGVTMPIEDKDVELVVYIPPLPTSL